VAGGADMSSGPVRVEASGDTVGEARWAALHELERRYPGLDRSGVEFQVVSEGARGLLGVGYEPARVVAVLADPPAATAAGEPAPAPADESPAARRLRDLMERVLAASGVPGRLRIEEHDIELTATVVGDDLGILIGRHGQTIDALQYLANVVMHRKGEDVEVVIDAQGYRERRARMLHEVAATAAAEARRTGEPVELEPMTSVERKIIHLRLKEMAGVRTESAGLEPNRHVVVIPGDV
jgi:spoIIIJ-associated protein